MQRITASVAISLLACMVTAGSTGAAHARQLQSFGIEGMGTVSTPANEVRASISPDGQRIVWGSTDREGGAGGWDLWQARLLDGRWQHPQPMPFNSTANDFDPIFSANGRWLYFFSNRDGGLGGDDLYRVAVRADGFGAPVNLGAAVNTDGDEWAPTPGLDGRRLLFASDGHGGAGGHDLLVARWDGKAFVDPQPLAGINTAADEFDAAWLGNGRALVFARSDDVEAKPIRLLLAQCDGECYADPQPLPLAFNDASGTTLGPVVNWHKPAVLLVTGHAKAPHAGGLDIYRIKTPKVTGTAGCLVDTLIAVKRSEMTDRACFHHMA